MKLSDYVASFIRDRGVKHVFAIAGGACLHLIDSIARTDGIDYVCPQHEQAGAMAADAVSRVTGGVGVAISTSGPGATNMITGICCAYYDSVPVLYITGQVATFRLKRDSGIRQFGFQETDIVTMCKPITKYAVLVEDPKRIRYELEKAWSIARSGRPGPVLVDIPDNLQREEIDPEKLEPYAEPDPSESDLSQIDECLNAIRSSKRPVAIIGWGVQLASARQLARKFVERLGIPVIPTWGMADFLPHDHPLYVGTFGLHGTRYGNFTVQNADLILALGTRLDTHETGSPLSSFAREAKKIVVDIDPHELEKFERFGMDAEILVRSDAKEFLGAALARTESAPQLHLSEWKSYIADIKAKYPICPEENYRQAVLNPYVFMKELSRASRPGEVFIVDTGCAVAWMMQGFDFKEGQRVYSAYNNTPMGYSLPASIGASLALNRRPITCVVGDGSLQMNIQELATVLRHDLPIRIFLINNHGYSMIQQTQDQWLGSRYEASSVPGGLAFPDFAKVAQAYGYRTSTIKTNDGAGSIIEQIYATEQSHFCNVDFSPEERVIPQVVFGRPIEDAGPLLPREEFFSNMLVKPMEASSKS